ncbi:MAG TPA: winged helix-turn-helix domain-containing protein, partial [Bryobacteraceae bacterium]
MSGDHPGNCVPFRFGLYPLDSPPRELWFEERPVSITPRALAVLHLLVSRDGGLVTKDDLIETVWGGAFVHESNITKYVAEIRRVLRPGFGDADPVTTTWKVGYRFNVPVLRQQAVEQVAEATAVYREQLPVKFRPRGKPLRTIAVSSLLLAILIAVALPLRRRANTQDAIAVMALQDSCGSSEGTWLGAALQETLMDQLQTSGKLHVLRRADISRRLGGLKINTSAGIDSVALKRMSADYGYRFAVTGTYWTSDGALRVELHAIDLA